MNTNSILKPTIYLALIYQIAILLGIYAMLRLGFYLINIDLFPAITSKNLGIMMLGGIKFDIAALLYINSLFILLQSVPFPFRYNSTYQKICKWILSLLMG